MFSIRLKPVGVKRKGYFHVVAIDSRKSIFSEKYKHKLGYLNTHTKNFKVNIELYKKLITNGAKPSKTIEYWIKKKYNI